MYHVLFAVGIKVCYLDETPVINNKEIPQFE